MFTGRSNVICAGDFNASAVPRAEIELMTNSTTPRRYRWHTSPRRGIQKQRQWMKPTKERPSWITSSLDTQSAIIVI